ncbi:MAG TPA: RNA degradosome polyphosphate kinase [Rhodospirillales bacterium]|nr:RNA degradosome polyphosphate kinase [Rhodospirillales bacterium]
MSKFASDDIAELELQSTDRFINRELSWLAFNARVLEEADNETAPILERVNYLSISASNLDEFYMVRIAGLRGQVDADVALLSEDGLTPLQQMVFIREEANQLMKQQQQCWRNLRSEMKNAGIKILEEKDLLDEEKIWLTKYFDEQVFPILTPLAIDSAHPFPFIPNLGFSMILKLRRINDGQIMRALIPFPQMLDRFVKFPGKEIKLILVENIINLFLANIFPDFEVEQTAWFRIIRDTEVEIDEEAEDLMRTYQSALKQRIQGSVIRLSLSSDVPEDLCQMIVDEVGVDQFDVVRHDGLLGLSDTGELFQIERKDLKFTAYEPRLTERVRELDGDCFKAIRAKDFVVHHPYESFDVVVQFIRQAAQDPDVVAVKQTLYRTSNDSPTVAALVQAAEAGKSVTAMVELKARFDEEANIKWARDLERAGANVVFGFIDKKTHAKISLVVRREGDILRSYAHFGTGNYHPQTAKIYTDLSFFTCEPELCHDAAQIFNFMTGYTEPKGLKKLSVSPLNLRDRILGLIEKEIQFVENGKPATIWIKLNAIVDPIIIDALYRASNAGVSIELIVRGICCLRPGVPGLSMNIRVKSIIGRFLEHSRIVVFGNGSELPSPNAKVFISSADWMPRNLNWRVEVLVPIENPTVHQQILEQVMIANLTDVQQSWTMASDGTYDKLDYESGNFSAHTYFMTNPSLSGRGSTIEDKRPLMPHLVSDRSD